MSPMKKNQTDMLSNAALFGLFLALTSFLLQLFYWVFDVNIYSIGMSLLNLVINFGILIFFYWLSNKTLRDKYLGGSLTYGQGFVNLLITGIVSVIIGSILNYLLFKYIAPDYLPKMAEKVMAMLQSNPNVPEETIEKTQAQFALMTPESTIVKSLYFGLGSAVVFSLIVSAFTKKKPDIFAAEYTTEEEK